MIKKRNASYRAIFSIIIAAITFAVIYFDYYASYIGIVAQLALAALVLVASGLAIRTSMGFKGGYGVYMLSGKHGISQVDAIAKSSKLTKADSEKALSAAINAVISALKKADALTG